LGIQCKDFVLLAADGSIAFSIMVLKQDEEKISKLSDSIALAVTGESGDTVQFSEFISKNIQLYKMRNGYELSPSAAANFTRRKLAEALRSRNAYQVNLLMGGYDEVSGVPELYYIDYLATLAKVPYGAHGYGAFFSMSIMEQLYRPDMSEADALDLMKKCICEVQKRFLVNLPTFKCVLINKNGIKDMPDFKATGLV